MACANWLHQERINQKNQRGISEGLDWGGDAGEPRPLLPGPGRTEE